MSQLSTADRPASARMVHFGLGAFHRAHQAVYAAAAGEGIVAVAPRSRSIVDAMRAQDCLYTVTDRVPGPLRPRVVGSILEALHMRSDVGVSNREDPRVQRRRPARSTQTLTGR